MLKISKKLKYLLGTFVLLGYLSMLIYTPIHMIEMVEMNMPMEHCPFAMNQHVICTMTIFEHVNKWKNWIQSFLPDFKILTNVTLFFTLSYLLTASPPILRLLLYSKQQGKIRVFSFLQNLFSQGVLHTKVF